MIEKEINIEFTRFYVLAWILLIAAFILLYNGFWLGWICYFYSFVYSISDIYTPPPPTDPTDPPKAA